MVAQVVAILALILGQHGWMQALFLHWIGYWALWLVVLAALLSGADYFRRFQQVLSPRVTDFQVARDAQSGRKAG